MQYETLASFGTLSPKFLSSSLCNLYMKSERKSCQLELALCLEFGYVLFGSDFGGFCIVFGNFSQRLTPCSCFSLWYVLRFALYLLSLFHFGYRDLVVGFGRFFDMSGVKDDLLQSISVQLIGHNYSFWSYVMQNFLKGKHMWDYVSRTD